MREHLLEAQVDTSSDSASSPSRPRSRKSSRYKSCYGHCLCITGMQATDRPQAIPSTAVFTNGTLSTRMGPARSCCTAFCQLSIRVNNSVAFEASSMQCVQSCKTQHSGIML